MQAKRETRGTRALGVTLFLVGYGTLAFGLARADALMVALGLALAATSLSVYRGY